jgi:hypothetical protein
MHLPKMFSFSEGAVRLERFEDALCVPELSTARAEALKALSEVGPTYPEERSQRSRAWRRNGPEHAFTVAQGLAGHQHR